jgi:hypothetical protein
MSSFVSVDQVERTFPLGGGKEYIALKGIDLLTQYDRRIRSAHWRSRHARR